MTDAKGKGKHGRFAQFAQEAEGRKAFAQQKDNGMSGNGMVPHDMWRRLIPIAIEYDRKLGDMAILYTYLMAHVNGDVANDRYMAAWPNVDTIVKETGIGKNRVAAVSDALEAIGLIRAVYDYTSNKRDKLYYPLYYSSLSDEVIRENMAEWNRKEDARKAKEKASRERRKAEIGGQSRIQE